MKPSAQNLAIAFLAATSLGLTVQLYRTREQLAEARQATALEVKRTEVHVAAAPEPVSPPPPALPASSPESVAPPEANEASEPERGPGGPGGRGARFAALMTELLKDPEFAAAWKLDQEARIDQRYGEFLKQLKLAPEKVGAFKALLIERENAGRDVWSSARQQGLDPRDPAARDQLRQLTADLQAEVDANIEASFGPAVISGLDQFDQAAPQRATLQDLSPKLAYAGQPLSPAQGQMLSTILAETGTHSGRNTLITDATIARAQGVLSPVQLEGLRALQAEQKARQIIAEKTRAAREQARSRD